MATLNGLRLKGVKVELGIPEDLWNATSAETSKLKRQCDKVRHFAPGNLGTVINDRIDDEEDSISYYFQLLEEAEESIEEWYMGKGEKPNILDYLCRERLLKGMGCSLEEGE